MKRLLQITKKRFRIQTESCSSIKDDHNSKDVAIRVVYAQMILCGLSLAGLCILSPWTAIYMLPGCLATLLANVTMIQLAYMTKNNRMGLYTAFLGKYCAFIVAVLFFAHTVPNSFPMMLYGICVSQIAYIVSCSMSERYNGS